MITYMFKVVDHKMKPTNWFGFVTVEDEDDLFWSIDEFTDPYSCLIKMVDAAPNVCFKYDSDLEDSGIEEPQFGENVYLKLEDPSQEDWQLFVSVDESPQLVFVNELNDDIIEG